jgi:uncharacterized protein YecT (DUF1311 family)
MIRHNGAIAIVFIALLLISASSGFAQEPAFSKTYTECMDKSGGVTMEMLECSDKEMKIQDKRLNAAYQALMKETAPKRQQKLRDVQRMWLAFRKANCDFYHDPEGGTAASLAGASCLLTSTANRAKELEDLKME